LFNTVTENHLSPIARDVSLDLGKRKDSAIEFRQEYTYETTEKKASHIRYHTDFTSPYETNKKQKNDKFVYDYSDLLKTPSAYKAPNGAKSKETIKHASSIGNRKYHEIENSVRGKTIFRQKYDEGTVYPETKSSIISTHRENNGNYETDKTLLLKSANFSQMQVEVNPF